MLVGCVASPTAPEVPTEGHDRPVRRDGCPVAMARVETDVVDVCVDLYEAPGFGVVPRTTTFGEAEAACEARGARLCTEQEWEVACRGPEGLLFPYGDEFDPRPCDVGARGPVGNGTRNACRSGFGTYDMSGNAAEWVAGGWLKGGAFDSDGFGTRCGARARPEDQAAPTLTGYRCCAEPE